MQLDSEFGMNFVSLFFDGTHLEFFTWNGVQGFEKQITKSRLSVLNPMGISKDKGEYRDTNRVTLQLMILTHRLEKYGMSGKKRGMNRNT